MANYEATKYDYDGSNISGIQGVNTGIIVPWSSTSVPSGFLECNGANVSRSTYSGLFAVISTTYGSGDGSSTFTLPNLNDRIPVSKSGTKSLASTGGAEQVAASGTISVGNTSLSEAQLPSHNHPAGMTVQTSNASPQGPQASASGQTSLTGQGTAHNHSGTFSGSSTSVLQPYLVVLYIIKT